MLSLPYRCLKFLVILILKLSIGSTGLKHQYSKWLIIRKRREKPKYLLHKQFSSKMVLTSKQKAVSIAFSIVDRFPDMDEMLIKDKFKVFENVNISHSIGIKKTF